MPCPLSQSRLGFRFWFYAVLIGVLLVQSAGAADRFADATPDSEWVVTIRPANPDAAIAPTFSVPPAPAPASAREPIDEPGATTFAAAPAAEATPAPAHDVLIRPLPQRPVRVNNRTYEEVYHSIPYNRTEYLANPGYRHEATMEILFGELRPTTIVKESQPEVIVNDLPSPYQPYLWAHPDYNQYRAPAFRLLNPGCYW